MKISRKCLGFLAVSLAGLCRMDSLSAYEEYDYVIKNGRVVDGTGSPWYYADVAISEGKIARIGRIPADAGKEMIDAKGLFVAPGFIDMMGQTATPMMEDPKTAINLLSQGITTINAGEGQSAAPVSTQDGPKLGWTTMAEYFTLLDLKGLPVNVVQSVGHTQVRRLVLGDVDRRPTAEELNRMQDYVREGMEAGAIGVSTALIYPPAVYAETEEIAALCKVAGEHGGRYFTHMRNEGDRLLEAIDEALEIGQKAETPVHIFHLKAAGRQNWGKMPQAIAKIKAARASGQQVAADIYPYINNGLGIAALIHPKHFREGYDALRKQLDDAELRAQIQQEMESTPGWENWYRHVGSDWNKIIVGQTSHKTYGEHVGKNLGEIAKISGEDPWSVFFELAKTGAFVLPESMTEANKILAMKQEFISFCTDVGPAGGSRIASHPRAFGSFPRMLSRYVRDWGVISLERSIAQASATAANEILAYDRGRIAEGLAADVILFDYEELTDTANFVNPQEIARGMKHVFVNGELVFSDGKLTKKRPGRVLRGPGYRQSKAPENISTGQAFPEAAPFEDLMQSFIATHQLPGAAIAVTNQGRLVLAKGYGYADVKEQTPVTPESLFRIASLSKPITAVAILQLIEQGKLGLDDRVFDILDWKAEITKAGPQFDARQREITIRHLLEHRGGWARDQSFDGMFQSVRFAKQFDVAPPADQPTIIKSMLRQPLDFAPGERYAYSNYGYCLLGRVIEKLTDQSYGDYVKQHVLAPLGIHSMRLGKTRIDGRAPNEVRYYYPGRGPSVFADDLGELVPWPYGGWFLESMDSHGAWIASAVDLARFATAFDDPENCKILSAKSIRLMYRRPPGLAGQKENGEPKETYYSLGWSNETVGDNAVNHSHTGSLPGTATILIRRHDGRNFIALFNARSSPLASHMGRAIEPELHRTAQQLKAWPMGDLFPQFSNATK